MVLPTPDPGTVESMSFSGSLAPSAEAGGRIRIVIADGHDLYRRGLQAMLALEPDLQIVAEATSGGEATQKCLEFDPDVVLLGVRMPGNTELQACAAIKQGSPRTKIVILTASDDDVDFFAAITAGASGYLLKNAPIEQIAQSVRLVHDGRGMIPPEMARQFFAEFSRLSNELPRETEPDAGLTEREHQVLALVAEGKTNKEIATQLFLSVYTVKNHVRSILKKLQLHSRVEAAIYAVRRNVPE